MTTAKKQVSVQDTKGEEIIFPNDFVFAEAIGFQQSKAWKTVEEGKKYYAEILEKIKEVKPDGTNAAKI